MQIITQQFSHIVAVNPLRVLIGINVVWFLALELHPFVRLG
jgi:hypothetical protein